MTSYYLSLEAQEKREEALIDRIAREMILINRSGFNDSIWAWPSGHDAWSLPKEIQRKASHRHSRLVLRAEYFHH